MTKLIAFGDSIFAGWDGTKNVGNNQRIPELVAQEMGWAVENWAISGTKYDDTSTGFPGILDQHPVTGYDYAMWMYGVNNFGWPDSLDSIKQHLQAGIDKARQQSPTTKLLMVLPTQDFRWGGTTLYDVNSQFWSQNQLDDALKEVAQQNGVAFLDWRDDPVITPDNAAETLGDGAKGVHPTADTMVKLAGRIADKFKSMLEEVSPAPNNPAPNNPAPNNPTPSNGSNLSDPVKVEPNPLKLQRLADGSDLVNNLDENQKLVIDCLNGIDSKISSIFGTNTIGAVTVNKPNVTALNRETRNYMFSVFGSLESYLNQLVELANEYGLVDPQTGQLTSTIALNPPINLTINQLFVDAINDLWARIESLINNLQTYVSEL